MEAGMTREQAWSLLREYNQEPFHLQHALTVEAVMRWYANELGYGEDADFWALCGLLHDVDFERWPDQHCVKAAELLPAAGDELTGLIGAAAKMRPSKSCTDMELSSLKKKFKDKKFAAGCSRDVIRQGAERLGWELDTLLDRTLQAMRASEAYIQSAMQTL